MSHQQVLSVSEIVFYMKQVVESEPLFKNVAIVGEISNFSHASSGHFYFSLKDEKSSIRVVMFRTNARKVLFKPKNGDKVILIGRLGVYGSSGSVQFYAEKMNLDGLGDLFIEFERLRKELMDKGYFDSKYKKPLPEYPMKIGIITANNSAALSDMTRTLQERWPVAKQFNFYSLVQGDKAKYELVDQIQKADASGLDLLIIARGGGSIEDLWPFNEVQVAMAIFHAKTPIITGIGHESDVTLADYVSDYRAATPTGAIMDGTPNYLEVNSTIRDYKNRMYIGVRNKYLSDKTALENIYNKKVFKQPQSLLDPYYMILDGAQHRFARNLGYFNDISKTLDHFKIHGMNQIDWKIKIKGGDIHQYEEKIVLLISDYLRRAISKKDELEQDVLWQMNELIFLKKRVFNDILKAMRHLSPFEIMSRGYGAVFKDDSSVSRATELEVDDYFELVYEDGRIVAKVVEREIKK